MRKGLATAVLAVMVAFTLASQAFALDRQAYSSERFAQLQAEGALILVDVYATWCPTCALQQAVLQKYVEAHPESNLHVLVVDFDKDRESVRALRVPRQSTLLLYKGEQQFWYSVAETREDVIFDAINRAAAHR